MSFLFSKFLWAVLAPLNLVLILLFAGLVLSFKFRRAGKGLVCAAAAVILLVSVIPVGQAALRSLESYHSAPEINNLPPEITGVIILGGALDPGLTTSRDRLTVSNAAERVLEGLYLARQYPKTSLIYAGGEGTLKPVGKPEAGLLKLFVARYGFDDIERIVYEDKSRNTYENALYTKEMVNPGPDDRWILVTSAYHMPRAVATFKSTGWHNIIPWPADYRTKKKSVRVLTFDALDGFNDLTLVWHEALGIAYYALTGKINTKYLAHP